MEKRLDKKIIQEVKKQREVVFKKQDKCIYQGFEAPYEATKSRAFNEDT
jgi:hypothetical protein